jgi:hypothetical protein
VTSEGNDTEVSDVQSENALLLMSFKPPIVTVTRGDSIKLSSTNSGSPQFCTSRCFNLALARDIKVESKSGVMLGINMRSVSIDDSPDKLIKDVIEPNSSIRRRFNFANESAVSLLNPEKQ